MPGFSNYDNWKLRSPDDDRPDEEFEPELEEMDEADWLEKQELEMSEECTQISDGWQPISTAPKTSDDFSSGALDFLAWCPDETARHGGDRRVVWWEPKLGKGGKGCWWCDADFEVHPTLWQPLPARPA